jgi:hypothetical protein
MDKYWFTFPSFLPFGRYISVSHIYQNNTIIKVRLIYIFFPGNQPFELSTSQCSYFMWRKLNGKAEARKFVWWTELVRLKVPKCQCGDVSFWNYWDSLLCQSSDIRTEHNVCDVLYPLAISSLIVESLFLKHSKSIFFTKGKRPSVKNLKKKQAK